MTRRRCIKAIPTKYKGITFRSTVEAEWACFWDQCGITWVYEPVAYDLGYKLAKETGSRGYLPDFYLPAYEYIVEIKGDREMPYEVPKMRRLSRMTQKWCFLHWGGPHAQAHWDGSVTGVTSAGFLDGTLYWNLMWCICPKCLRAFIAESGDGSACQRCHEPWPKCSANIRQLAAEAHRIVKWGSRADE